eukprot:CAMPEP_0113877848 /NCGR_PEP_ID=MMETSP0780_2-20120614/6337_1 /TAXON_ID=652834 /ORGANISM="Palpitomonas bilix" /LENGTH=62 /DNA_ID=CAMNT_0000864217 /DNA_START=1 /DNA_END=185 /DNA_ORIENTATION=- /assembly_acc=CAM_ASM_000599
MRKGVQQWVKALPEDKQDVIRELQEELRKSYSAPLDIIQKVWLDLGLGEEWEQRLCKEGDMA